MDADSWLGRIQLCLDSALQSQLLGLAAAQLPANTEEKAIELGKSMVSKALERALAREKSDALARLRRVADNPNTTEYIEVQQLLVTLERERRALMEA